MSRSIGYRNNDDNRQQLFHLFEQFLNSSESLPHVDPVTNILSRSTVSASFPVERNMRQDTCTLLPVIGLLYFPSVGSINSKARNRSLIMPMDPMRNHVLTDLNKMVPIHLKSMILNCTKGMQYKNSLGESVTIDTFEHVELASSDKGQYIKCYSNRSTIVTMLSICVIYFKYSFCETSSI